jgi:hypothetical protein
MADFTFAVLTGLSTYARDGASRAQLRAAADLARHGWFHLTQAPSTSTRQPTASATSPGRGRDAPTRHSAE